MSPDEVLFIAVISAAVGPISWEAEVLTHSKALPPLLLSLKLWALFYPRFLCKLLCRWFIWEEIPGSRSGESEKPIPECVNKLISWPVLGATND